MKIFENENQFESIIISGDFNINLKYNGFSANVLQLFTFNGFKQLIDENTRYNSLNDLVFVRNYIIKNIEIIEIIDNIFQNCDHKAITFEINFSQNFSKIYKTKTVFDFNETNLNLFNTRLYDIN